MCNLSDGVYMDGINKGISIGKDKVTINYIVALMDSLKITTDEAMDILDIPADEQPHYRELVEERLLEEKNNVQFK